MNHFYELELVKRRLFVDLIKVFARIRASTLAKCYQRYFTFSFSHIPRILLRHATWSWATAAAPLHEVKTKVINVNLLRIVNVVRTVILLPNAIFALAGLVARACWS